MPLVQINSFIVTLLYDLIYWYGIFGQITYFYALILSDLNELNSVKLNIFKVHIHTYIIYEIRKYEIKFIG